METFFILAVVGLTSAAAATWLARGRARRSLGSAAGKALESVGLVALFFLVNVGLGFSIGVVRRAATGRFVSFYVNDDVSILVLSVLQALVVQWWREPESDERPRGWP